MPNLGQKSICFTKDIELYLSYQKSHKTNTMTRLMLQISKALYHLKKLLKYLFLNNNIQLNFWVLLFLYF